MLVYLMTNRVTGKQYVGQTTNTLRERRKLALVYIAKGARNPISRAILEYGINNFLWGTLHTCHSQAELDYWEAHYICVMKTLAPLGYNVQRGAGSKVLAKQACHERLLLERYKAIQESKPEAILEKHLVGVN